MWHSLVYASHVSHIQLGSLSAWVSAVSLSAVLLLNFSLLRITRRSFTRQEQQERRRLHAEVLGLGESGEESGAASGSSSTTTPGHLAVADTRFALLLVDYYAYGLTQARRSFAVSLSCSLIGGLVLIAGVGLAIFRADTNGQAYAAIVTSVAGVLTASIGTLFHQQANRALKHMEQQTNKLRQDMKTERDAAAAIDLLSKVDDDGLRSQLQAALILRFAGATLPSVRELGQPVRSVDRLNGNGELPEPAATEKRRSD